MVETPFSTAAENARYFRAIDTAKNGKAYTLTALVPIASTGSTSPAHVAAYLRVDIEGGFHLQGISGRALGPCDASGVRVLEAGTSFPAAGTTLGYADRGLAMIVTDVQSGVQLTTTLFHFTSREPRVEVGSVMSPGYGFSHYFAPMPVSFYLPQGTLWRFDLFNQDSGGSDTQGVFHRLDMVLSGVRYVR